VKLHYLLDTNTLSEPLKKQPNQQVFHKIQTHQTEIATAAPVLYEIIRGAYRLPDSKKRAQILQYVEEFIRAAVPILPYTEETVLWHSIEVARLMNIGKTPSPMDSQIAAIAKTNDLILVTRNVSDFEDFMGLQVEDWF